MNFNIFKKKSSSYDSTLRILFDLIFDLIFTLHREGILNAQILADNSADRAIQEKIFNIRDTDEAKKTAINLQSLADLLNKHYPQK